MNIERLILIQIVQIAVLAMAVWLVTSIVGRKHTHLSFVLWLVVLVKCITPPIWSSPTSIFSWLHPSALDVVETGAIHAEPEDVVDTLMQASVSPSPHPDDPLQPALPSARAFRFSDSDAPASIESVVVNKPLDLHSNFPNQEFAPLPGKSELTDGRLAKQGLVGVWLVVTGIVLVTTTIRALSYFRQLARVTTEDRIIQRRVDELCKRLKIRQRICVRITSLPIGPAVVGLFRPMIVLPEMLTKRFAGQQLDPILAHELIHIRRGDLWTSLLRHAACSLWWFHPLVWKAGSAVRRGAEACCDEEVVSSLGISSSTYARSLLNVLELKRELRVIPVVPGVRPFDITADRLEKIMKCGTKRRMSTPIWCWLIAALLGLVTLPGAGLMLGKEAESTPAPDASDIPTAAESPQHVLITSPNVTLSAFGLALTTDDTPPPEQPASDLPPLPSLDDDASTARLTPTMEHLPWALLQRTPHADLVLKPGDILGVYIEGVVGNERTLPPLNVRGSENSSPSIGYPIPIRSDGTISLPLIGPQEVAGLTLQQAEARVVKAYTVDKKILAPGEERIFLSIVRRKQIQVFVFREDLPQATSTESTMRSNAIVTLGANEADVLTVLAKTGGLPKGSVEEILIQRRIHDPAGREREQVQTIRIPLRYRTTERPKLTSADITLRNHDIVVLRPKGADQNPRVPGEEASAAPPESAVDVQPPDVLSPAPARLAPRASQAQAATTMEDQREPWRMSLAEAIQIGLANSQTVRTLGVMKEEKSKREGIALRRLNPDVDANDIEINVRNYLLEVCQAYWELYFQYHNLDAAQTGFAQSLGLWKLAKERQSAQLEGGEAASEAQARAQHFAFKSRLQQAESDLNHSESRLQYLLGIRPADGRMIQPTDQPSKAKVSYNWEEIKQESLQSAPELRRQRRRIEQQEKVTLAAKQQLLPQMNSDGTPVFGDDVDVELFEGDFSEWRAGRQFQLPIGIRAEMTQLRNLQLQLRRARKRLADGETEITHQLSSALRRQKDRYGLAQTQYNALKAARDQVKAVEVGYKIAQNVPLDVVLDAQSRQTQSEIDYFRALTEYQLANLEIHFRKGTLLRTCGVELQSESKPDLNVTDPTRSFYPAGKNSVVFGALGL